MGDDPSRTRKEFFVSDNRQAPTTPLQLKIAGYWRELLDVPAVYLEDHFIEIGGNSLMATMLANYIEEELGVRPGMADLFNTLDQVAAACEELLRAEGKPLPAA